MQKALNWLLLFHYFGLFSVAVRHRISIFSLALVFQALLQTTSWAQTNPFDPVVELRRQQERELQDRKRLEPVPQINPETPVPVDTERLPISEMPCHKIDTILIDSGDGRHWGWLLDSLDGVKGDDSPFNRCLGVGSIGILLKRGQNALVVSVR